MRRGWSGLCEEESFVRLIKTVGQSLSSREEPSRKRLGQHRDFIGRNSAIELRH